MDSDRFGEGSSGKRLKTAETTESPPVIPSSSGEGVENAAELVSTELSEDDPSYASICLLGRSRKTVDTISTKTSLCSPQINRRLPVHFFGVYHDEDDYQMARLCRERMHSFVKDEILRVGNSSGGSSGRRSILGFEEAWMEAMRKSFEKMNEFAISHPTYESSGEPCSYSVQVCESAAVVAIVTLDYIVVANFGSSHALLCRAGRPIPIGAGQEFMYMPDEFSLITTYGARVRGDENAEPNVIADPDVTFTNRETQDQCLILASDGLWDVITSEFACQIACECLRGGDPTPYFTGGNNSMYTSRCFHAASILTRLALGEKTSDNISVIVIDLKRYTR